MAALLPDNDERIRRAKIISERLKPIQVKQAEIVQEIKKTAPKVEEVAWLENTSFSKIAIALVYEYQGMTWTSGKPEPMPKDTGAPGDFLATNLAPHVRRVVDVLVKEEQTKEAQIHLLKLLHQYLRLSRQALDLIQFDKSHLQSDRIWSPSLLTFLLWEPHFQGDDSRAARLALGDDIARFAVIKPSVFQWLINDIVPDIRRETESHFRALNLGDVKDSYKTPLQDLLIRVSKFFGTCDPAEPLIGEGTCAGERKWLESKYGKDPDPEKKSKSSWVEAVEEHPFSVAFASNDRIRLATAATAWQQAAKLMYTNVISYQRSPNFRKALNDCKHQKHLFVARVYLPFMEVVYTQLSIGAKILVQLPLQLQNHDLSDFSESSDEKIPQKTKTSGKKKGTGKKPQYTILERPDRDAPSNQAIELKGSHERMNRRLHEQWTEYGKHLRSQTTHEKSNTGMISASSANIMRQNAKVMTAFEQGKAKLQVKEPNETEAVHDLQTTATWALKRLLKIGESGAGQKPLHELELEHKLVIPTPEIISNPVKLMEFADETYNVGNQAGQENLEAARFKAAQTSWPVRLYHGYHMVGIFDIAVPWNSRTKEWDYSGLESLDAAIFACLRKDGSHPITVVPVDWLQVKSVHRATVAMRTK